MLPPMELLWTTDPHLDHVRHAGAAFEFGKALRQENPRAAALLVTGDIAEAQSITHVLRDLARGFESPVYFILGNHDFYMGSFESVTKHVAATSARTENLHWLRSAEVRLSTDLALAGCDGWYDARYGDRLTDLQLTDFRCIAELFEAQDDSRNALLAACANRADAESSILGAQLDRLLQQESKPTVRHVVVATHVPPFQDAAWYEGKPANDYWAPFFSSKVLGDQLRANARKNPAIQYHVFCGHTHSPGVYQAEDNLTVYTGAARYGAPELAGVLRFEAGKLEVDMASAE